jgi:hypothetical protein
MTYDEVVGVLRSWVGQQVTRDPGAQTDLEVVRGTLHEGQFIPPEAGVMVEKIGEDGSVPRGGGVIVETSRYHPNDSYALFTISRVADPEKTSSPFGVSFPVSRGTVTRAEWVPGAEGQAFDLTVGEWTTRLTREPH